jgi:hypothetical protein
LIARSYFLLGGFMDPAVTCFTRRYMAGASVGRLIRSVPLVLKQKRISFIHRHIYLLNGLCRKLRL